MDFIGKQLLGQWVARLLIAGHVLAALYHHWMLRDTTLNRMLSD